MEKEDFFRYLLSILEFRMELKRGSGECIRCYTKYSFNKIEEEFRVKNEFGNRLSLLCKKCRKEVVEEIKENQKKGKGGDIGDGNKNNE